MARWNRKSSFFQTEAAKAATFNQQIGQLSAHLRDKDYTGQAGMSNLSALIAQEETRSFGSGRVIARDQDRAIDGGPYVDHGVLLPHTGTPIIVRQYNPILCWQCGKPLSAKEIDPEGRIVACQSCAEDYRANEQMRESSYQEARQERAEHAQEEQAEWRRDQYECRIQEQAEVESRKGERYETGTINLECEYIQGSFGMDYLYNPILHNFFELRDRGLVPLAGDLILESSYKKEQVSGSGWVYWLLIDDNIVVVEVWEEILFPGVIEKVEVL